MQQASVSFSWLLHRSKPADNNCSRSGCRALRRSASSSSSSASSDSSSGGNRVVFVVARAIAISISQLWLAAEIYNLKQLALKVTQNQWTHWTVLGLNKVTSEFTGSCVLLHHRMNYH